MVRHLGTVLVGFGLACAVAASGLDTVGYTAQVGGVAVTPVAIRLLLAAAVALLAAGVYLLTYRAIETQIESKRRQHDVRNILRLAFLIAAVAGVLGALTEQWLGLLFSLGVVGFAITFALQQPLFSFLGWFYIVAKRPYQVGDRVAIEGSKGDVADVDYLVTTLWEIDGELVASNQPSGRIITVPNSVVLSSHVTNYTREEFPFVWNEIEVQVAYETDREFARATMAEVADEYLGDEMARRIEQYRDRLAETPVELDVQDRPTVNVVQEESWVTLRLRYLVHPRRGQRTKNALYERVLAALNEHPERVKFPIGRNR
ncbi:mechanosensitive ion channel family protein [Halapricum hydrolyticum]|uniref:Mechanosensitive ion channel family protein n=1 Tax=Halapricum hydrolyticum TaxID=2979991 RepID=A0AAE3I9H7_9EURY|nr:mechanosensitive ion channel family protein [Halapricum hydrolyticum]MCU4716583.1 mechanosensitive ion channel family protein [Halapricum hydrolyticum]MCU4725812.1 mechanosensitive ion channel family protein [Halapricum hydrolyticum]